MGRELKRKEAKRSGKNVKEVQKLNKEKSMTPKGFSVIMIAVVLVLLFTYLFTGIFATKDIKWFSKNNDEDSEETTGINNKILASDSLKQVEENYYVYYYDTTDEDVEMTGVVTSLSSIVYRVDLHDDFNTNFVGEASGVVDSIEELKVANPTVIKVSSGKIVAFYSGEEIKSLK